MEHQDFAAYRERQRRAYLNSRGAQQQRVEEEPARPHRIGSENVSRETFVSSSDSVWSRSHTTEGTENDALLAEMLAREFQEEQASNSSAAAAAATKDVDPETAAMIAKVLGEDLARLEREGLRPPDTVFTERLIPTTGADIPPSQPFSTPPVTEQRLVSLCEPQLDATEDDALARRLQEEEFARDTTTMDTLR